MWRTDQGRPYPDGFVRELCFLVLAGIVVQSGSSVADDEFERLRGLTLDEVTERIRRCSPQTEIVADVRIRSARRTVRYELSRLIDGPMDTAMAAISAGLSD